MHTSKLLQCSIRRILRFCVSATDRLLDGSLMFLLRSLTWPQLMLPHAGNDPPSLPARYPSFRASVLPSIASHPAAVASDPMPSRRWRASMAPIGRSAMCCAGCAVPAVASAWGRLGWKQGRHSMPGSARAVCRYAGRKLRTESVHPRPAVLHSPNERVSRGTAQPIRCPFGQW
jgi:hypothetical protein